MTEETYDRLLARDESLDAEMLQGVAAKLGVAPHLIAECVPRPTAARLAELAAIIAETDAAGAWLRIEDDGTLTPNPEARAIPQG